MLNSFFISFFCYPYHDPKYTQQWADVIFIIFRSKELGFSINGHMTIFNQEFKDSLYYRSGSANDVESLTTTFRKFGIEPSIKLDFKRKDIVNEIKACK